MKALDRDPAADGNVVPAQPTPILRLVDLLCVVPALLIFALPMLLIATLIRIQDGGPAIFRQVRVGKNLVPFTVYKFRTMRVDDSGSRSGSVDPALGKEQARTQFETTVDDDPRITPIGRLLRPSHLDELPQLLNVLAGHMSLVGVRPDTFAQEADYSREYWRNRHALRPGITGPAQIHPGAGTMEDRTRAEQRWLANPSLGAYFAVVLGTLAKVASRSSN